MPKNKKSKDVDVQTSSFTMKLYKVHSKTVQYRPVDEDGSIIEDRGEGPCGPIYVDKEQFGEDLSDKEFPKRIRVRLAWK